MSFLPKKYGFALVMAAIFAVLVVASAIRMLSSEGGAGQASRPANTGAAAGSSSAPPVQVAQIVRETFYASAPAIGTAQAYESIVVTPKVADVIEQIAFESGDRVRQGEVLVRLSSVEQRADLAEARATLEAERRDFDRIRGLAERGFAPKATLDQAQAAFEAAEARVRALESRIADRTIRAPFSGVMGLRTASPGQLAQPGDPIGTLDDVSRVKLDFNLPEPQITLARGGGEISARTAAFPDAVFSGKIESIDSRVDPATRTLRVRAILPNRDGRLKPGMLMTVEIKADPREGLAAPELAVLESAEGPSVFRVVEGEGGAMIAERAPVRLGRRSAGKIEILEGVAAGDRIVTVGVQRVRPGQPVRIENAPPAQASQPPARAPS